MPLFAGWRARLHAGPTDGPARLALALQAAREHRGSCHLVAVTAAGVDPLQAVMSGRYGAKNAEFFGWPEPYPDPEGAKEAMGPGGDGHRRPGRRRPTPPSPRPSAPSSPTGLRSLVKRVLAHGRSTPGASD